MRHDGKDSLSETDPQMTELIEREETRQENQLCLIPSENHISPAVLAATGTVLTNKYAEGYPGRRYYEGCEVIDEVENLAIERARSLFGFSHVNVQPYSGSPANLAVYGAFVGVGNTVLGMSLPAGGHLTHGWKASMTGKWFHAVHYGVRPDTGRVDLDEVRDLAKRERPQVIFCGGTAVPRTIDFAGFAEVAREVDALLVADMCHVAGLVAGGAHPSPLGHAQVAMTTTHKTLRGPRGALLLCDEQQASALDKAVFPGLQGGPHNSTTAAIGVALHEAAQEEFRAYAHAVVENARTLADELIARGYDLVSGGTDNHLLLVDLSNKGVSGRVVAEALARAGIVCNRNSVPFDTRPPFDPSGIRLGTPALTTRGLGTTEMVHLAGLLDEAMRAIVSDDEAALTEVGKRVRELADAFPTPGPNARAARKVVSAGQVRSE